MIEYITGKITALSPTAVVLETNSGVAYLLNITLPTYTELQGKESARLLVHESIREDAWVLYGFLTGRERELFRALIGVSGVGTATAVIILSAMATSELEQVIASGDDTRLKRVKGIGQKTAQRIIVDLKDKITVSELEVPAAVSQTNNEAYEEALTALQILGYPKPAVQRVLKRIFDKDPSVKVEGAIKQALAML